MLPPPPPSDESEGSKIRVLLIVGVLIAVLVIGLFGAWMILQSGRENAGSSATPTPYATPVPTTPPEFSIETTSGGTSAAVYPGDSTQVTLFVRWQYGNADEVSLTADTSSSGIQTSFSAGSSRPDFSSVLTITVPYYTNPDYYTVVITATNGAVTHNLYYTVQVLQR
jgi:hypothetical protein